MNTMAVELIMIIENNDAGDNTFFQGNIKDYRERPGVFQTSTDAIKKYFNVQVHELAMKLQLDVHVEINIKHMRFLK